jgi:hypothetical protein
MVMADMSQITRVIGSSVFLFAFPFILSIVVKKAPPPPPPSKKEEMKDVRGGFY